LQFLLISSIFDKKFSMIVERTDNQIIIKVSPQVDPLGFQRIMDYLEYLEITSKSKATQSEADELADELNENWWTKNRNKFIK
jgi:predicted trehalose synthase